jgi:hypothetical protein
VNSALGDHGREGGGVRPVEAVYAMHELREQLCGFHESRRCRPKPSDLLRNRCPVRVAEPENHIGPIEYALMVFLPGCHLVADDLWRQRRHHGARLSALKTLSRGCPPSWLKDNAVLPTCVQLPAKYAVVTVRVMGGEKCSLVEPSGPTLTVHTGSERSTTGAPLCAGVRTAGCSLGHP